MVRFIPLNITDEDSVEYVLSHVDNSMQYGEDLEPKVLFKFDMHLHDDVTNIICIFRNLKICQNMTNKNTKTLHIHNKSKEF
jgi:hypothetical protein